MKPLKHGSLFNGIGGFQLAAEWMGWENVMSCEIDEFCNRVTKYYWPNCVQHGDIKTTDFTIWRGKIDILTGGFPCQSFSLAGKGKMDLSLWKEMLRTVRETNPRWVVAENVRGLLARKKGVALETVCSDLEAEGYTVFPPFIIPACSKGAPHRRERIWIIAYSNRNGCQLQSGSGGRQALKSEIKENKWKWVRHEFTGNANEGIITNASRKRLAGRLHTGQRCNEKAYGTFKGREFTRAYPKDDWSQFPTVSPVSIGDDGLSSELVQYSRKTFSRLRKEGIKASGNAISPQVVFEIFKVIDQTL